jgi:hypothetical protein
MLANRQHIPAHVPIEGGPPTPPARWHPKQTRRFAPHLRQDSPHLRQDLPQPAPETTLYIAAAKRRYEESAEGRALKIDRERGGGAGDPLRALPIQVGVDSDRVPPKSTAVLCRRARINPHRALGACLTTATAACSVRMYTRGYRPSATVCAAAARLRCA